MVATKKKIGKIPVKKESEHKIAPPAVRVVTEVVEDLPSEPLAEIKQDAKNIEKTVEELEETVKEDQTKEEASPSTDVAEISAKDEIVVPMGESMPEESKAEAGSTETPQESTNVVVEKLFKQDVRPAGAEISEHRSENPMKSLIVWVFTVVVVALITGGGLLVLVRGLPALSSVSIGAKPTPTPLPSPAPSPTPVAPNRAEVKIQVLNGGGKAGAGSAMKKLLETKGYTVVEVGNTEQYSYDKTQVVVKSGKEGVLALLKEDLKDTYTLEDSTDTVPDDVAYDARVTVGKE
jgi:hypothetical protein